MNFSTMALTLGEGRVSQFAFDGTYYYFTLFCQETIIQTTGDFCPLREISTSRDYDCLCFDYGRGCFWASVSGSATRLFQLDCHLREIGCVSLDHGLTGRITGLSYHGCEDCLYIAYPTVVGRYDKGVFHPLPSVKGLILSLLVICPGYLLVTRQGKHQVLHHFFDTGEKIFQTTLPEDIAIQGMAYNGCCQGRLDLLLRERACYSKMCSLAVTAYELGFEPCICNHKICHHSCPCLSNPIDEVIESIALVEASLSHILNAQGEELQKVVAGEYSLEEMLQVNGQVNKTICKVTQLERVLCGKLEELKELAHCHQGDLLS